MNRFFFLILINISFIFITSPNILAQSTLNDTLIINELLEVADSIMSNEPKNAKILVDSAMVIAKKLELEDFVAKCLRKKIEAQFYLGHLSKVIEGLFTLLSYHEARKDTGEIAICFNDIGITYADKMEYALSLKYLYKALKLEKQNDRRKIKASVLGNIGYTYLQMEKYDDAHEFFNESLNLSTKIGYMLGIANANNSIGKTFKEQENYDSSLVYFKKALKIYKKINHQTAIGLIYQSLGELKYYSKNYNEAIKYFQKAANVGEKTGVITDYVESMCSIAYTNNTLGNFNKAISIYEKALSKINKNDDKELVIFILKNINDIYAKLGNYAKAYNALKKYSELNDEVFNTKKSEQIEKLKIEFETEQKETEIENLKEITTIQNESLQQRQMIIFLLVGSLALLGLLGYLGISRYKMKTQQNAMELEQRLLRSQMNPHFIFNSLSVIQGYIFKGSPKEAASYLSNFGKLMRNILENSREEYVMLDKEIETLNHYLELQNLRHGGKINFTIETSPNLLPDSVSVPPMLAQPFIENSIKHGMNKNGEVTILVKYLKNNSGMKLIIEDNGIGINKSKKGNDKSDGHKSLAISITEGRLQLLSKRAKSKYKLSIVDIGDKDINKSGTRVEVELPYLEEF